MWSLSPNVDRSRPLLFTLQHTHTVAPVWRAERGQPLGGGCARPAGLGVLRSAAHRRAEFRLPVWLRGVYFIIAVHHAFVLGLGPRHGGIVKLSVVRCVTVFACFTLLFPFFKIRFKQPSHTRGSTHTRPIAATMRCVGHTRHFRACLASSPERMRPPPPSVYSHTLPSRAVPSRRCACHVCAPSPRALPRPAFVLSTGRRAG